MGVFQGLAVAVAEDFGGEQADHAGDPVAIQMQGLEVGVARLFQVHFHAVDDLLQLFLGQRKLLQRGDQGLGHRMARTPLVERLHLAAPPGQLGPRQLRDRGIRRRRHRLRGKRRKAR
jgi:hypothetical protein